MNNIFKKYLLFVGILLTGGIAFLFATNSSEFHLEHLGPSVNNEAFHFGFDSNLQLINPIANKGETKIFAEPIDVEDRENEQELKTKHKPLSFDDFLVAVIKTQLYSHFFFNHQTSVKSHNYQYVGTSVRLHKKFQVFII